jgi:uncharacterized membrane-anchored protein YitT (DUF2179 family)
MADIKTSPWRTIRRLGLVILGAALMAFNIKTFIQAGALIPGGFTGLSLLIQEICLRYLNIHIPFSVLLFTLNAIPAVFCFRFIGKKFTLYSILMVVLCGLMADFMPAMFVGFIRLHDTLLSAVFGGILNAVSVVLCLYADATSGGTDFIAIYLSEKYSKDAWSYIFAGNCVILIIAGSIFSLDKVLYSIIFQFTTTIAIGALYHAYQQKTLLVITTHPNEVYSVIKEKTRHGATVINGTGMYNMKERHLLYSVVHSDEVEPVVNAIHIADPGAFINVIKTEHIYGNFIKKPID